MPILHMRKLKSREVEDISQKHEAGGGGDSF